MMLEPRKKQCATCPFRKDGWTHVRELLSDRALNEATPICHSTGPDALKKGPKKSYACRGARDLQLQFFCAIGFLPEPTDKAWNAKAKEMNLR